MVNCRSILEKKLGQALEQAYSLNMKIEEGFTYEPAGKPYMDYLTADEEDCFNYINVWQSQASDVHPPLYYVCLHTICSLFPGTFSKWYAGVINIFFAIMTLWVVRRTVNIFSTSEFLLFIASVVFIFSPGILNAVSFFRMYVVAMFCVALITYQFIKIIFRGGGRYN